MRLMMWPNHFWSYSNCERTVSNKAQAEIARIEKHRVIARTFIESGLMARVENWGQQAKISKLIRQRPSSAIDLKLPRLDQVDPAENELAYLLHHGDSIKWHSILEFDIPINAKLHLTSPADSWISSVSDITSYKFEVGFMGVLVALPSGTWVHSWMRIHTLRTEGGARV